MQRTHVYIVCSPRPRVGKTLIARLQCEFQLLQHHRVLGFDVNLTEPSLVDFLPRFTETADISDTSGEMALMDRLILNDGVPKVVDLGYPAFENFFRVVSETGFDKEAASRGIEPIVLFMASTDRAAPRAFADLRARFPKMLIVPVDNEAVTFGEAPAEFSGARPLHIRALPKFLQSILDRTNFSFVEYLRTNKDPTTELDQWIRAILHQFRELDTNLILRKLQTNLR